MCDPSEGEGDNDQVKTLEMEETTEMVPLEATNEVDELDNSQPASHSTERSRSTYSMFAAKKTVAQGMMDIALITANANQLRYLLEYCPHSESFYIIFALIVFSLFLQVIVGVFLIFKGRQHFRREKSEHAERVNNCIVFGVFLITVINVFISAFSVNA